MRYNRRDATLRITIPTTDLENGTAVVNLYSNSGSGEINYSRPHYARMTGVISGNNTVFLYTLIAMLPAKWKFAYKVADSVGNETAASDEIIVDVRELVPVIQKNLVVLAYNSTTHSLSFRLS